MSRKNKVNPDHYKLGGRLTPDEAARERMKQGGSGESQSKRGSKTTAPKGSKQGGRGAKSPGK